MTAVQTVVLQKLSDPLAIPVVALASMQCLHLHWIRQNQLKAMALQHVPEWPPVNACGLHRNLSYLQLLEPATHPYQFALKGPIYLLQWLALLAIRRQYAYYYRLF